MSEGKKSDDGNNKNKEEGVTRKKHKFNVFDFSIVVIFFLVLSVVGIKIVERSNQSSKDVQKFCFTVEAQNLDEDFAEKNKISVGDEIRDSVRGYYYGRISDIKQFPAKKITEDNINGVYLLTDVPNKSDMQVTVECMAKFSEDAITVDGNPVRIGKLMSLKSKGYVFYGYIVDMDLEGGQFEKDN